MPGNRPHYGRWPQHDFPPFKKLRPQSVTSRIQPGSDVIVCAEELHDKVIGHYLNIKHYQ
ncbi:transposase [Enterobacter hormaechei subsp. xiangfangensis]|nr:transposase [Enterobacter hormaechei subsp. xiangfangensis]KTI92086.1 transposase [Enterobacter hormaechei subsp. xiangfangensis]KVI96026.1 transposase [Enterobacter hormaechei subsp. hoffmannii]